MERKRAALSALVVAFLLIGLWTGRASAMFWQSDAQLLEEMNQAVKQAGQAKEIILLREMLRREMVLRIAGDPLHRYGGQPCRAAD